MKKLIDGWMTCRLMDEAGAEDGGADAAATGTEGGAGAAAQTTAAPAAAEPANTETAGANTETAEPAAAKPFLGGEQAEKPTEPAKPTEEKPKSYTAEDYAKGIVKDEKLLGTNKNLQIDQGYIKAMAPVFNEMGLSPEQANKLANAFAKVQVDSAREQLKARNEYFEKMKDESMRRYNENDWRQINAGIDATFKRGGAMNYTIRNSELGADPEFLALMHKLGAAVKADGVAGAAAGSGDGAGDGNSFDGIHKLW